MRDGRVLVVGSAAAVYDPRTGAWEKAAARPTPRVAHTATLLPDGRVLTTGGYVDGNGITAAELYDPLANRWQPAAPMSVRRYYHTASLLPDGTVLVVGGLGAGHGPFQAQAERYDPVANVWRPAGELPLGRGFHTATVLPDGQVVVLGGQGAAHDRSLRDALQYDPASNGWTVVPQLMAVARARHTASLLPDGKVLVAGGTRQREGQQESEIEASTEVFDPKSRSFAPNAPMLGPHVGQTATWLPNGALLVAGGEEPAAATTAEIYDPVARRWTKAPRPTVALPVHTATLLVENCGLRCGMVLLVGSEGTQVYATRATDQDGVGGDEDGGGPGLGGVLRVGLVAIAGVAAIGLLASARRRAD